MEGVVRSGQKHNMDSLNMDLCFLEGDFLRMSPWPQRNVVIVCIGLILGTVYLLTLAALLPSWISK